MSGTGFGIGDGSGGFVSKLEADGDAKIGNSSGDVLQITGSVVMNENVHFLANGRVGINTDSPAYKLGVAGNVGINEYIYHNGDADTFMRFQEDSVNFQAGGADFITLTEAAQDEVVINESSADIDFRVESNNATHMFFIDGASNRIGVGTSGPQHTIDIQERTGIEAVIRLQGTADVGIRLAADSDNSGENDNPYIDWYQDGQNSNSRNNRLASIAMEGDAGATFTGSIANALILSTFCPNAQSSSLRPFQIATDSSNNGFRNRFTIEGTNGYVGINTSTPSQELEINGTTKSNYYITTPTATDLGSGTSTALTASTSLHFLDADSVTLATGKDYFEITLADGTTAGQHLQLAITSSANNPVRVVGDSGGDKAQGTVSFSGAPSDGQTVSFPTVGGGTTYVVTWDAASPAGNFAVPSATSVVAGIGGAGTANDMGFVMYNAIDTGISVSSWPFTLVGSYGGGSTVTLSQNSAGTSGNQTITENSDNTTVTGFAGGTALVEGTINSTYGVALAGTSAAGGLLNGAHFVWDATTEKWQIIAGTQLTS